jgi:hypothetical protein
MSHLKEQVVLCPSMTLKSSSLQTVIYGNLFSSALPFSNLIHVFVSLSFVIFSAGQRAEQE